MLELFLHNKEVIINQYIGNATIFLNRKEANVDRIILTINSFNFLLRLCINWHNFVIFWCTNIF